MGQIFDYISQYSFVRYALIVGVLISLCSSLLGVTLVLKRFSFIGDGLSHVAFGVLSVATVLQTVIKSFLKENAESGASPFLSAFVLVLEQTNGMVLVLPLTILTAIILLQNSANSRIKGDASIAMLSVGALAMGYLIMNVFSASANISGDVCSTLFGSTSILTLKKAEVWTCIILSTLVVLVFVAFYNKIFAITFDENFAAAVGTKVKAYNLLIATVIATIIVLAMNLVGSLLISALVIFPALSAMRLFKSFFGVTLCSAILSVSCALTGLLVSILADTPVGSTIVAVNIIVFLVFSLLGRLRR